MKQNETSVLVTPVSDRIVGSRPSHVHTCLTGGETHTWNCNSPYCEERETQCPAHGGFEPIVQGREPWRGR